MLDVVSNYTDVLYQSLNGSDERGVTSNNIGKQPQTNGSCVSQNDNHEINTHFIDMSK